MIISVIVAIGKHRQIGLNNELLWQLSDDLKRFKNITKGHHIVMGRKTFESIGRPLPNRTNVIVTRDQNFKAPEGCVVLHSIDEVIEFAKSNGESELFFCGGAAIYLEGLERCDKLYLTEVDFDGDADTYFPDYNQYQWEELETSSVLANDKNEFSFVTRDLKKIN